MTDRLRTSSPYPSGAYYHGSPLRSVAGQPSSSEGLSSRKTMLVLVVVVGCFAVLWPKLFYPILVNSANNQMKPGPVDRTTGCCDVISELDLDTIKIMSELCGIIIENSENTRPNEILSQCKKSVLETCGIDISATLQDRIYLGHSVKQMLEEVRSLNGSLCLKYNFGLSPWKLGVPHRLNIQLDPAVRQERPSQLRPGMVHPAFKERGRAIPESDASPERIRKTAPPPRIVEGKPGSIPGMRPTMGGPGHVVPPPKHANYGFMGVLMPIYTVGFVIFFTYTIMKLVFKKKPDAYVGAPLYPPCETDELFQKEVFEANKDYFSRPKDPSKIVVNAVAALLEEVDQEIEARTQTKTTTSTEQEPHLKPNGALSKDEDQGSVTVMAMERTASAENGKKWSRPHSPVLPHSQPISPKEPTPTPQQIFLEGSLPPLSQLLVADSATEAEKNPEGDSPVVLAGKMTLSVISLDSEDSSGSGNKPDSPEECRRTTGSNTSDEYVKIDADELEEQTKDIIVEAEGVALAEENRYQREKEEERTKTTAVLDLSKGPTINEKDNGKTILEEIKNPFKLEDYLLKILKDREPEGNVSLPDTDIIKEFLDSGDNALDTEQLRGTKTTREKINTEDPITPAKEDVAKSDLQDLNDSKVNQEAVADEQKLTLVEALAQIKIPGQENQEATQRDIHSEENAYEKKQNPEVGALQQIEDSAQEKKFEAQEIEGEGTTQQLDAEKALRSREDPQERTKTEEIEATLGDLLLQGHQVKEDTESSETTQGASDETKEPLAFEEEVEYVEEIEEYDKDDDEEEEEELSKEDDVNLRGNVATLISGVVTNYIVAENEISDEDEIGDDEEEIEEIIEYVDNSDEEGEEIIEINVNEDDRHHHVHQNGEGN